VTVRRNRYKAKGRHAVAQGGMAVVQHVDLPTARVRLISTPVSYTVCKF
jgi:hypothetical protein